MNDLSSSTSSHRLSSVLFWSIVWGLLRRAHLKKLLALRHLASKNLFRRHQAIAVLLGELNARGEHSTAYRLIRESPQVRALLKKIPTDYSNCLCYTGQFKKMLRHIRYCHRLNQRLAFGGQTASLESGQSMALSRNWTKNIGHITLMSIFELDRRLGTRFLPPPYLSSEYRQSACNPALLRYFEPLFDANPPPLTPTQEVGVSFLPTSRGNLFYYEVCQTLFGKWQDSGDLRPILTLADDHRDFGQQKLQQMGLTPSDWFVGLHMRETGYHKDPAWHQSRNCNPLDYLEAIREITNRGGWVIRMGDNKMTPLPPMPRVIDYAHSAFKSAEMDVFLCARAKFYLGCGSGLSEVPRLFNVRTLFINWWFPGLSPFLSNDIVIPKWFRERSSGRYLSFSEGFIEPIGYTESLSRLRELGLEVLPCPSELIKNAVIYVLDNPETVWTTLHPREKQIQSYQQQAKTYGFAKIGLPAIEYYESKLR